MTNIDLLTEKLDLLRRGSLELEQLRNRVGELQALAAFVTHSSAGVLNELQSTQMMLEQWQSFFELSLDMLCVASVDGFFLNVNPSFQRTLGYSREELVSKPFFEFIHPDDLEATQQEVAKLKSGGDTISFENRYRCKDGQWKWLNWTTPAPLTGSKVLYAIARDVTERKHTDTEILHRAMHDALTGLYNRAAFTHELQKAVEHQRRDKSWKAAVLFIDLDGFKAINDQHGHHVGDVLLTQVAQRLITLSRVTDTVARLGGDEFVVLLQNRNDFEPGLFGIRVEARLQEAYLVEGKKLTIGASIGIAMLDEQTVDAEAVVKAADTAMYVVKRRHRGGQNPV